VPLCLAETIVTNEPYDSGGDRADGSLRCNEHRYDLAQEDPKARSSHLRYSGGSEYRNRSLLECTEIRRPLCHYRLQRRGSTRWVNLFNDGSDEMHS